MNDQMDSYIKWREQDRQPDTPQLVLELDGSPFCWTESRSPKYSVAVSLRRVLSNEPDSGYINQPFWLRWFPFIDPSRGEFILLCHDRESGSLQRVGIEERSPYTPTLRIQQFPNEPASFYTAEAKKNFDRCKVTHQMSFPLAWEKLLQPGYTYTLLWTGQEIANWDWGTQSEVGNQPKWPPVLVPGGAHITFTVKEGERPPFPRLPTPPPISPSKRVPGAPVLSLELSCSPNRPTIPLTGKLEISIRVIYHGVLDNNNNIITSFEQLRPITFHTWAFRPLDGQFRVYRRRCQDQSSLEAEEEWEPFYDDGCQQCFWDNPDKLINVSENPGQFPTLFPGESWSDFWTMDGECLPDDRKPGDRLRYQFKGNTLDWWDWGTAGDHAQTIVTLPGSGVEPISSPKDNEGRPKVVVPASNIVEWAVVGD